MKQCVPFLSTHLSIRIPQYESNCSKEIAFTGTIVTDDDIVFR